MTLRSASVGLSSVPRSSAPTYDAVCDVPVNAPDGTIESVVETRLAERVRAVLAADGPLAGNALWLLSSNIVYSGAQWAAVVALAKLGSPTSLGYFGLALAVATPVVMVTGLALRALQATDVLGRYAFADYLNVRLAGNVVAAAVIASVALLAGLEGAAVAILVPVAAAKLAESTSETCYGLAQRHDRMRWVALSKGTRAVLGLAALVAVVALGGTLATAAWALAATWLGFLVVIDLRAAREFEPVFARSRARTLARLTAESAPLGAVNGVLALTQSVPRYQLQLGMGAATVGYFTALAAIGPALAQLAAAVGHAAAPRLAWAAAHDLERYRALTLRLIGAAALLSGMLAVAAAGAGRWFLTIAYTEEYAAYHSTFVLVVIAAGLWVVNTVAYFALVAARRPRLQLAIQMAGLLVTAVGCTVLIPRLGLNGAALALILGGATMTCANGRALLRVGGMR